MKHHPSVVAFLGPEGTFTQIAARTLFGPDALYRECATIEGVFDAVASGDATRGVAPIENSTEGPVGMTSDALLAHDLSIRQELVLPVAHCLLSRASAVSEVETVYSHPQALAQCRAWLETHAPDAERVPTASTAAAAREARSSASGAAVASALAAEIYDLPILRADIQDRDDNATRFVVVSREDVEPPSTGHDRTTVAFGIADGPGALRRVLSKFEEHGVNMTRIESRPSRTTAWRYVFLADVDGHRTDPNLGRALAELGGVADFVRVFGSYPRAENRGMGKRRP